MRAQEFVAVLMILAGVASIVAAVLITVVVLAKRGRR